MLMVVYVGDSGDIVKRILTNHCRGNVEGSALRKAVAEAMGYSLKYTRRPSGSMRVRIDLSNPNEGERRVSNYLLSGRWKYFVCDSYEEAHDFQWYVIEMLKPILNLDIRPWNREKTQRYQTLLANLDDSPSLSCRELRVNQSGPGVYVLYHEKEPHRDKG